MKKLWITTTILIIALALCFGLTACAEKNSTSHEHEFSTDWSTDDTNHWHSAICEHEEEKSDVEAHSYDNACDPSCDVCGYTRTVGDHVYDNACDTSCNACGATRTTTHDHADTLTAGETTHWYACSVCGDKKDETAHVFDKAVATDEYLKAEATATTKAQYYKSCVCGAKSATEYFETDKAPANLQVSDISKTYDGTSVAEPTVTFDGVGGENFAYYKGDEKLNERPTDAGTYKVVVTVGETDTHAGDRVEREFTIAKKTLNYLEVTKVYNGKRGFGKNAGIYCQLGVEHGVIAGDTVFLETSDDFEYNVGKYYFVRMNSTDDRDTVWLLGDDADNYDFYGDDVVGEVTVTKRPVWAENVKFTYDGYTKWTGEESPNQIVFQNMANGESMDSSFVKWTFDSKDVGATLASVAFVDEDDGRSNYEIDFSKCTASIEKRVIGNLDLSFEYNGESYFEITYTRANLSEIATGDTVRFEVGTTEADAGVYTIANGKLEEIVVGGDGRVGFNYEVDVETCKVTVTPIEMSFNLSNVSYNGTDEFKRGYTRMGGDLEYKILFLYTLHANGGDGTLLKNAGDYTDVMIESYQVYDVDEDNNIIRVTPNFELSKETLQQVVPNFSIYRIELFEGISLTTVYNGEKGRTGLTNATIENGTWGEDELTLSISGNTAWNVGTINLYSQEQLDQTGFVPVAPYEIVTIVGEAAENYFMLDEDTTLDGPVGTIEVTPYILECPTDFTKTYDGTPYATATLTGLKGESVTVKIIAIDTDYTYIYDAGTYTGVDCGLEGFFIDGVETENYDFSLEWYGTSNNINATIEAKEIDFSKLWFNTNGYVYDPTSISIKLGNAVGIYERDMESEVYISISFANGTWSSYDRNDAEIVLDSEYITAISLNNGAHSVITNYKVPSSLAGKTIHLKNFSTVSFSTEAVGASTTSIACNSTYDGDIYAITVKGGTYSIIGSNNFFGVGGVYDNNGNKISSSSTFIAPAGTYYFTTYVSTDPTGESIWVKKTGEYESFETARVFECQTDEIDSFTLSAGDEIYLKIMGGENSQLNDFVISVPTGSAATFTLAVYGLDDTTEPSYVEETALNSYYWDVCNNEDFYVILTCVTAGDINISAER